MPPDEDERFPFDPNIRPVKAPAEQGHIGPPFEGSRATLRSPAPYQPDPWILPTNLSGTCCADGVEPAQPWLRKRAGIDFPPDQRPQTGVAVYNVVDFGANPDPKSAQDDADAIQSAIDQALADGVGTVFIPRGVYDIRSPIRVRTSSGARTLRVVGDWPILQADAPDPEMTSEILPEMMEAPHPLQLVQQPWWSPT